MAALPFVAAATIVVILAGADGLPTRDAQGRIARSGAARHEFMREHPCPSTAARAGACPGYVIDHITPLCKGGPDRPDNMQWQTIAEAKAKNRWECRSTM